jgi:hypothetical protein
MTWTDSRSGKTQPVTCNIHQTAQFLANNAPRGFTMRLSREWDPADGNDCRNVVVHTFGGDAETPDQLATALALEPDEMDAEMKELQANVAALCKATSPNIPEDRVVKTTKPATNKPAGPKRSRAPAGPGLGTFDHMSQP